MAFDLEWGISFLVLGLAILHVSAGRHSPRARLALAAGGAIVGALWLAAVFRSELLYANASRDPSPISFVVDDARYWITTLAALALFASAYVRRKGGDRASEYLFVAFAFGPLGSVPFAVDFVARIALGRSIPTDVARGLLHAAGSVLVLAIVLVLLLLARSRGRPVKALALWLASALAVGVLAIVVGSHGEAVNLTLRFGDAGYLLVRPLVLGYALLRHQVFDVDVRVKRSFTTTVLVTSIAALFLPTVEVVRRFSGLSGEMALVAGMAVGIGVVLALHARVQQFAQGASARVFPRVNEDDSRYLAEKKREVYRAALERALDPRLSMTSRAERELAELRAKLGIADEEHEVLLADARAALQRTPRNAEGDATPAERGTVILGRYEVVSLLGEGGSGWTYRCRDARLGRDVAVKEVRTDDKRRGAREAQLLASVHHPRVVTLHEVHESGSRAFLVMELMERSLAHAIRSEGPLSPSRAARLVSQTLEGLEAMHAAGLVHRDLKPSNVLLDASGGAKVADLGVARDETAAHTTRSGLARAGTPAYMAPEQVLGGRVDARTDVYAAGALLFELLAGEPYVREAQRRGRLVEEAIVSLPPPLPLDGVPGPLGAWLARSLAKDPDSRFATAREARESLSTALVAAEGAH